MSWYAARNAYLSALGYASYQDYLSSDLWRSIRERALSVLGRKCSACGKAKRLQVHHTHYSDGNLSGRSLEGLAIVCSKCHGKIEFAGGKKVSPEVANARLAAARRKRGKKAKTGWCRVCKRNRSCQGGPCPPCAARLAAPDSHPAL